MSKYILGIAVVMGILGTVAFFGYSPFLKVIVQNFGSSTQGATNTTAKQYSILGVNLATPGANATSSSELNNTGQDLYITTIKVGCEGVGTSRAAYSGGGLASLTFTMSTTSTAAPASGGTTISTITVATSSGDYIQATSTASIGATSYLYIWPANSYLTFIANATNTAVCTVGADAFSS